MSGTLFVVATPIGNLSDLTHRAHDTLRSATRVAAEDTRRTRALLSHLGITGKPLIRLDAHATAHDIARALSYMQSGETLALVTDAGTPLVSDPGAELIRAAKEAGLVVIPIPGPSAVLAALAGSGLVRNAFRFLGFVPRSGSTRALMLAMAASTPEAVVLFEAPGRLRATLEELAKLSPDRSAAVARELTKVHEEFIHGTVTDLAALEREWVGEITLVLGPDDTAFAAASSDADEPALDRWIDEALARGVSVKAAAEIVSARSGRSRREIYARIVARKAMGPAVSLERVKKRLSLVQKGANSVVVRGADGVELNAHSGGGIGGFIGLANPPDSAFKAEGGGLTG